MPLKFTFRNEFTKFGECIRRKMKNAMRRAARKLARYSREDVPVDTGFLRDSIQASGQSVTVGASYAGFVEFGTVKMAAQPFFWPAVERVRSEMHEDMRQAFQDCKDGKSDNEDGEAEEGAASAAGEAVGEAGQLIGEGVSALGEIGAEVAAEGGELAELLPLLLL